MAVSKIAAGHGSTTKARCSLALLLFAGVAGAQTATPEAPAAAAESTARPAVPAKITYVGGQLQIYALGSTLAEVLTQVATLTGAKMDVPAGAASERMPVVELGPGPARQILAELLGDSNFDYLIQSSDADPEKLQAVLLMPREKKTDAPRASRGPYLAAAAPPEAPVPDSPAPAPPEMPAPDASSVAQPAPATAPAPVQPDLSGQPLLQPDTSNPAKPGALTPPATLTPQSINQQLQQMYQQRAQMTQQDHYTGTQLVLLPGAK